MTLDEAEGLILSCFAEAVAAVDPAVAVSRAVRVMPAIVDGPPPVLLAVGKAAGGMAAGLIDALPGGVARGVLVTKERRTVPELPPALQVFEAGHPIPDERSIRATRAALAMLEASATSEPVVILLSGGGSALFEAPVDGVTLDDLAELTRRMLRAGATISELNAVRGRLSRVKQGGLLRFVAAERPVTLVLSDVIGNDLSVIASGPTVPPVRRPDEPRDILERLGVWSSLSFDVTDALAETTDAPVPTSRAGPVEVVADNETAVDAFAAAIPSGTTFDVAWRQRTGEARELAVAWVDECERAEGGVDVLVGGGEATVTVRGEGVGGRNTEFAVAAALELDRRGMDDWVVASLATDGDDGPTGAAGGIASRRTVGRAVEAGVDPTAALAANDTLRVLTAAGGVVVTGATGTNVNDLYAAVRVR